LKYLLRRGMVSLGAAQAQLREATLAESRSQALLDDHSNQVDAAGAQVVALRRQQNELRAQLGEWHRQSSRLHTEAERCNVIWRWVRNAPLLAAQRDEMVSEVELLGILRDTQAKADAARDALEHLTDELGPRATPN